MKVSEAKIIEVAYRLFKHHGIRSTSLQKVARACSISLNDINLIFDSKRELVLAEIRHTLEKKTTYLVINSSISPSAVSELKNFHTFIDDTIADLGAEILSELRRYHPMALDQIREQVDNQLIPYLQRIIERGISEEFYRNEIDSELYISSYIFIIRSILESDRYDWAETKRMINHINDIFLHGALSEKGMRIKSYKVE